MKTTSIIAGAVALGLVAIGGSSYNGIMNAEEGVEQSYSQIQVELQRRNDLLPTLASVIGRYAEHEKSTLVDIATARSKINAAVQINPKDLSNNEALQKQFYEAQMQAKQAFAQVTVLSEKYPDLKANKQFEDMMAQVEGSENRIAVARRRTQIVVNSYNVYVKTFPRSMVGSVFGFGAKPYFQASADSQNAPKIFQKSDQ